MNPREQFEGRKIPALGKARKDCLQPGIKVRSLKATGKGRVMARKDTDIHKVKSGAGLTTLFWSCKKEVHKYSR